MKKTLAILAILFCASSTHAAPPVELFNGTDLTGWKGYLDDPALDTSREFVVRDGVICLSGKLGYIHTVETYSDYTLEVEWRWPGEPSNSGIFQRVQPEYQALPKCFEIQLKAGDAGDLVCLGGARTAETSNNLAAIVVQPKANPSNEKPAGQWNHAVITCIGGDISVSINGMLQNRATGASLTRGYIGLQSEGGPVEFRNVKIQEHKAMKTDIIKTSEGKDLKISFFGHSSIAFEYDGHHLYNDPVSDYADYSTLPKADVILVGHEHGDHLDSQAINALSANGTAPLILGNATAIDGLGHGDVLAHGKKRKLPWVTVEALPAYNTSPEKLNFHPRERLHNGYILTFGGTRVYVAGDSEDTLEMMALRDIDIAFLPVNLPYTMTEEQAARAVRAIRPTIFYPYHYGGVPHKTDLAKLASLLDGTGIDVRVRPLE
ncbi:MAG: DUF1080 domain-containing protein [Alistipes sp.]|jgi:L-ascorbate metabolism protein UlaG (beta-lactamase superfamily)|nr:DUF1080 domain-containing protein [Alistipes sp.]